MNIVLAVGNKKIEKQISDIKGINVLAAVKKREQLFDTVLLRIPHIVIMGDILPGKVEYREIILKIKEYCPKTKIVFFYTQPDNEYKLFLDFLIKQGVYDFVLNEPSNYDIETAIMRSASYEDVKAFELNISEISATADDKNTNEPQHQNVSLDEKEIKISRQASPALQKTWSFLQVNKEEATISKEQFLTNKRIAVSSFFARAGSTHTAIEIASALAKEQYDVGVVVSEKVYNSLASYYMITDSKSLVLRQVGFYTDSNIAENSHNIVIYDCGKKSVNNIDKAFEGADIKILISPSAPWEIDALTAYLNISDKAKEVEYFFWPITDEYFKELQSNLAKGGYRSYKICSNANMFERNLPNRKIYKAALEKILK